MKKLFLLSFVALSIINTAKSEIFLKTKSKTQNQNGISHRVVCINKCNDADYFTHKHGNFTVEIHVNEKNEVYAFEVTIVKDDEIIKKDSHASVFEEKLRYKIESKNKNHPENDYSFTFVIKPTQNNAQ